LRSTEDEPGVVVGVGEDAGPGGALDPLVVGPGGRDPWPPAGPPDPLPGAAVAPEGGVEPVLGRGAGVAPVEDGAFTRTDAGGSIAEEKPPTPAGSGPAA
jgi:hypothetical protein